MKEDQLVFNEVKNYSDLIERVHEHEFRYITKNYLNENSKEIGLEILTHLPEEKQEKLLNLTHVMDCKMNQSGKHKGNLLHKIPTLIAMAIYLNNYEPQIENYSAEAFIMLAKFSVIEDPLNYREMIETFDEKTLQIIVDKSRDYMVQEENMVLVYATKEEYLSKEDLQDYLIRTPQEELLERSFRVQEAIVEKEVQNESRRI